MPLALSLGSRDHPRVCGEHSISQSSKPEAMGSSPRMRGALADQLLQVSRLGIIPAYAGSTPEAWR